MTATDLRRRLSAGALLGLLVLSGCGGGDASAVPSFLLSAEQVGGTVRDDSGVLTSAGPDKSDLVGGATTKNTVAYTRTRGGHREVVQLNAGSTTQSLFDQGVGKVRTCLATGQCGTIPRSFTPAPVSGLPSGTTGFASVYRSDGKVTRSYLRSYTFLEGPPGADDRKVMVSLLRTDGSNPSPEDLRSLTEKQVAKVEKSLGG